MATNPEYLLPKFGRDQFRVTAPPRAGETRVIAPSDTFIKERRLFNVLEAGYRDIAREAKPTLWAHAETFHQALAAELEKSDASGEHFQLWAGLVAAVFQGDLEVVRFDRAAVKILDEDLCPSLQAGLPIVPDRASWPDVLYGLHPEGGVTALRSAGGALAGGCYAPCLVFPALEPPRLEDDPALDRFLSATTKKVTFRLADLMPLYAEQEGFVQGFETVLAKLAAQLGGNGQFAVLQRALAVLRNLLGSRYAPAVRLPEAPLQERKSSFLGSAYLNKVVGDGGGMGNVGYWNVYPLRTVAGGKTVLFIPDRIDVALNPWAEGRAFPGTADHTRLCDLSIRTDGSLLQVQGRNKAVYQVSSQYQVLSLNPAAPAALRVVLEALCYQEGANALDADLLDPLHEAWRRALTNRDDLTPLVPLHTNLLRYFPRFLRAPGDLVSLASGGAGDAAAAEALCRLKLPRGEGDAQPPLPTFTWRARLIAWKLDEMQLPTADVWPSFRSRQAPHWSAYFVRTRSVDSKLALFFHGEAGIRERPARAARAKPSAELYTIERLTSPPRLAEVVASGANDQESRGLLFIDERVYTDSKAPSQPWRVGVDFGTSNTSVAFHKGDDSRKVRILEMRPWARQLLGPAATRGAAPSPYPGWFLQGGEGDSFHRGFFPTLLGYHRSRANDPQLLERMANPGKLTGEDCANLVGTFDLLGIKGELAWRMRDSPSLMAEWNIEDNIKWPAPGDGEDAEKNQRRKAFRTAFLELLLLHVAAEAFAETGALPSQYSFTYPLSMQEREAGLYESTARRAVELVAELASPAAAPSPSGDGLPARPAGPAVKLVNESQAVFRAYLRMQDESLLPNHHRVVLIDMGGGSADYAVFTGRDPAAAGGHEQTLPYLCFLDSMVLAGNRYFEFLQDITSDKEYETLKASWQSLASVPTAFPQLAALREVEDEIQRLRQFYTLRVGSMMPDKTPSFYKEKDVNSLALRETEVAETLKLRTDRYAPGHWMRSLFNVVLTHGLLLAVATVPGWPPPTAIRIVLAGNGWRMLPHAGVLRSEERVLAMARSLYQSLKAVLDHHAAPGAAPLPAAEITMSFMDGKLLTDLLDGRGVYSKDVVAAGGILENRPRSSVTAAGIVGLDLPVVPITGSDAGAAEAAPIVLPWSTSVDKPVVDEIVRAALRRLPADGNGDHGFNPSKVTHLRPSRSLLEPAAGPQSVYQQLQVLELMKTGGYVGPPRQMLDSVQWGSWNTALFTQTREALDLYGEASSERVPDRTSLIRNVWEYPLLRKQVRRSLFRLMNGEA
jgi:hypothetical protein